MPELKNSFTQGRMNKDLDERIIPSSEYREALNIGVATSEGANVGAAQNILGNIVVSCAQRGPANRYDGVSSHIAAIADPISDKIYRFIHTPAVSEGVWMDRIIEFDTTKPVVMPCYSTEGNRLVANKEEAVLIDIYKVETEVTSSSTDCDGGDTTLFVTGNVFQLRHGMLIFDGVDLLETHDIHVVNVEVTSPNAATLTLSGNSPAITDGSIMTLQADRVLNFDPSRYITGINVLDGMIFWVDNYSEPKKVNVERSKLGSSVSNTNPLYDYSFQNFDQHTKLIVNKLNPSECIKELPGVCDDPDVVVVVNKIYGCMDPLAFDYDPLATSATACCYVSGCKNNNYIEFNPDACESDPSACLTLCGYVRTYAWEALNGTGSLLTSSWVSANLPNLTHTPTYHDLSIAYGPSPAKQVKFGSIDDFVYFINTWVLIKHGVTSNYNNTQTPNDIVVDYKSTYNIPHTHVFGREYAQYNC